jgi:hypothetical protein
LNVDDKKRLKNAVVENVEEKKEIKKVESKPKEAKK